MKQDYRKNIIYGIITGGIHYLLCICLSVVTYSPMPNLSALAICFLALSGLIPLALTVFKTPSIPALFIRAGISLAIFVSFIILGGEFGVVRIIHKLLNIVSNDVADNASGLMMVFQFAVVLLSYLASFIYTLLAKWVQKKKEQ